MSYRRHRFVITSDTINKQSINFTLQQTLLHCTQTSSRHQVRIYVICVKDLETFSQSIMTFCTKNMLGLVQTEAIFILYNFLFCELTFSS